MELLLKGVEQVRGMNTPFNMRENISKNFISGHGMQIMDKTEALIVLCFPVF